MSRVALLNRVKSLEEQRIITAALLFIRGGLPNESLVPDRATIVTRNGDLTTHYRFPTESLPLFLSRLSTHNPTTITLGGLPALPGTSVIGF
jgi:hypothetical protein